MHPWQRVAGLFLGLSQNPTKTQQNGLTELAQHIRLQHSYSNRTDFDPKLKIQQIFGNLIASLNRVTTTTAFIYKY